MSRSTKILDRRFFPAGTQIIEEGTQGGRAYTVESGKVEVFSRDANGNIVVIAQLGPGSMIGEIALLTGGNRNASVRVVEDAVLVSITSHDLHKAISTSESFYKKIMRMTMERIRETSMKVARRKPQPEALNIHAVADNVPMSKKERFKKEVVPLLDELKSTLDRFSRTPEK